MFEVVEAIHKALRTESTFVFVLVVALVMGTFGAAVAWIVDQGYKNSAEYKQRLKQGGELDLQIDTRPAGENRHDFFATQGPDRRIIAIPNLVLTNRSTSQMSLWMHLRIGLRESASSEFIEAETEVTPDPQLETYFRLLGIRVAGPQLINPINLGAGNSVAGFAVFSIDARELRKFPALEMYDKKSEIALLVVEDRVSGKSKTVSVPKD